MITILAALLAAQSTDWHLVAATRNETAMYIDLASIRKVDGLVYVWEKWDHSKDRTETERETRLRSVYDCERSRYTILNFATYDARGKVLESLDVDIEDAEWDIAFPDSVGLEKLNLVCTKKGAEAP